MPALLLLALPSEGEWNRVDRHVSKPETSAACRLLNMGGPERLSRVDMAHAVAETWGRDPAAIQAAPAASVSRGVAAPPDISMRIDRLVLTLGVRPMAFADALARMPSAPSGALPSGNLRQAQ